MEAIFTTALYFLLTIFIVLIISKLQISSTSKRRRISTNPPPSPPSLPFIGHVHLLKQPLHRGLQALSNKYGPIFSLRLGVRNVVVVSSPSLAEECLSKNDVVFANRPSLLGWKILGYNYTTVGAASYGPHWRNLRRLSTIELLSTARINSFLHVRQDELRCMVSGLVNEVGSGLTKVKVKSKLVVLVVNMAVRMIVGKRIFDSAEGEEGQRFKEMIEEALALSSSANPVDFLPVLRWIGYGGLEKRMWNVHAKSDAFFQRLIEEHRSQPKEEGGSQKTMIDTMLSLQESEPEIYTDDIIKGQIMIMMLAGTETSSATIEWGMSLLLNHPKILEKARAEIDNVVGNNRLVEESDYANLPYLQHIVKETLRLYPAGPILMPHQSSEDCTIGGYQISKGTMLLLNAWAIHNDATVWEDPARFWPERHEGERLEMDGYKLMPFGMGRRSCPGTGLATRVVSVTLGVLIQCFEWERIGEELLDMSEGEGLTLPKCVPLEALCKSRVVMRDVYLTM